MCRTVCFYIPRNKLHENNRLEYEFYVIFSIESNRAISFSAAQIFKKGKNMSLFIGLYKKSGILQGKIDIELGFSAGFISL